RRMLDRGHLGPRVARARLPGVVVPSAARGAGGAHHRGGDGSRVLAKVDGTTCLALARRVFHHLVLRAVARAGSRDDPDPGGVRFGGDDPAAAVAVSLLVSDRHPPAAWLVGPARRQALPLARDGPA